MLDDKLMNDAGLFALTTESSFADGCDEVSEEDVDTEAVGLWLPTGPCEVVGADPVLTSCLKFGVDWKAYGCTGAEAPRYEVFCP